MERDIIIVDVAGQVRRTECSASTRWWWRMRGLIEWYNGVRGYEAASYPESVDDGMRLRIWMIPSNTN